jgi:hypothetical protein
MDEAHVEHSVRFIEYEDLDARKIDGFPRRMIQQASRGGNQYIHTAMESVDLRLHADTTKNDRGSQWQMDAIGMDPLRYLGGEFARGRKDECARMSLGMPLFGQSMQHRENEGRRFAGSGLCSG